MINIALIDDSPDDIFFISRILSKFPVNIKTFDSSISFGLYPDPDDFNFVFIDFNINHGAGSEAILRALTEKSTTRVVFISNSDDHLNVDKRFLDNPIVWGLLKKDDFEGIAYWMLARMEEMKSMDETREIDVRKLGVVLKFLSTS